MRPSGGSVVGRPAKTARARILSPFCDSRVWWVGASARRGTLCPGMAALLAACLLQACVAPGPTVATPVPVLAPEPTPVAAEPAPSPSDIPVAPVLPPAPTLRVTAVGDIMLGARASAVLAAHGYDYPFAHVARFLREGDLVIGNLEGPLTDGGQAYGEKQFVFRSPPAKVAPALAAAGFDVLTLANNHTMDYGLEGLQHTREALTAAGIRHAGAGDNLAQARAPAWIDAGGHRIAVLAYSLTFPQEFWASADRAGTAFGHEHHVRADVRAARERADVVIVSFHWGREATTELREYQPRLGRAAIDAGALIVLGHHPHVLQAIERYRDGVIFYSLGNFVFGSYGRATKTSIIAQLRVEQARLTEARLIPIDVNNFDVHFQPRPLTGERARSVIAELRRLSGPLQTTVLAREDIGFVALASQRTAGAAAD